VILVDTGPLVALCDARDRLHTRAISDFRSLARTGLVVCESVLAETCFHLPHSVQRRRLRAIIEEFDMKAVDVDDHHSLWLDVSDWLIKYADHEPDWADGCLAVLSGYDARVKVWTYDGEFRTTWRRPDGSTIPLAVKPYVLLHSSRSVIAGSARVALRAGARHAAVPHANTNAITGATTVASVRCSAPPGSANRRSSPDVSSRPTGVATRR